MLTSELQKPQFGHRCTHAKIVDRSISGGRVSRSFDPMQLVLPIPVYSLSNPQIPHRFISSCSVVIFYPSIAGDATGSAADCDNIAAPGNHCVCIQMPFDTLIFLLTAVLAKICPVVPVEIHNPAAMVIVCFAAEFNQVL